MRHWLRERAEDWLAAGRVPGDCLADLSTNRNALSVYEVENEADAKRVAAALALRRAKNSGNDEKSLDDVSLLRFSPELLDAESIKYSKDVHGETPDTVVNAWHVDLVDLGGDDLVRLARRLINEVVPVRFHRRALQEVLSVSVAAGDIPDTALNSRIRKDLGNL
jgi:hypothetical protein